MKRYVTTGIVLAALLVGAILLIRWLPSAKFESIDTSKIKGEPNAPIEIIQYSNFKCHSCDEARPVIDELFRRFPGKLKLVFRHFPAYQDQTSLWSHLAGECAAQKGYFWAYHDKLYNNQKIWANSIDPLKYFIQYAKELGMDDKSFSECLSDPEILKKVREEDQAGIAMKIQTTPTFLINGQFVVGSIQLKAKAAQVIEVELKKKGIQP